jgi:hypothetical protein
MARFKCPIKKMRITKEIADQVARQMIAKKLEKNEAKLQELKGLVALRVMETKIPKEVGQFRSDGFEDYLKKSRGVTLIGNGFNHEYLDLKPFPSTTSNNYITFEPTPEDAKIWIKLHRDYQTEIQNIQRLRGEIEEFLYRLKTYAKVEKEFPEAFKLLPAKQETGFSVCVDDLRKRLTENL